MEKELELKQVSVRFYDAINLGDDLLVRILASRYRNKFKVGWREKELIFKDVDNVVASTSMVRDYLDRMIYKSLRKMGWVRSNFNARRSDLVVYAGGSIFMESDNLSRWEKELEFYKALKVPYYIIGSNIGPYSSARFLSIIREIIAESEDTCLRDSYSYELVKDIQKARLSTDIAFALDPSLVQVKEEKLAVFSLIDAQNRFSRAIADKYEDAIGTMSESLIDEGYRVVYMSFCKREGDESASYRVLSSLSQQARDMVEIFSYDGDFSSAMSLLASSEIIIASRFHASIIGFAFGKKVLPFAYSDKTINVLKDIGFSGKFVDIRKIEYFDATSVDFDSIPIFDISEQRKKAEAQFEKLDQILERIA